MEYEGAVSFVKNKGCELPNSNVYIFADLYPTYRHILMLWRRKRHQFRSLLQRLLQRRNHSRKSK